MQRTTRSSPNAYLLRAVCAACFAVLSPAFAHHRASPLDPLPSAEFTLAHARHLLNRAGFGGTQEEVERLHRRGLDGMVEWLVDYESRPDVVGAFESRPPEHRLGGREFRKLSQDERRKLRQMYRRKDRARFQRLRVWCIERMLRSRRPLEEKLTLFWHGHFTTSYRDVRSSYLLARQDALLRDCASGNFGELLHAISKDPAMLDYLDNNQNRKGKPNENYAREVMELFALGVGNYDESDIKEAARAFTGWTFNRRSGQFLANRGRHDFGTKTVFGKSGQFDGGDVCDLLLAHEACAPYIAGKLFSWFAYANPEPEIVAELGAVLRSCRYELKPLLRTMFKSRAFYSKRALATHVKSPIELIVSTVRMLGMNPPPGELVLYGAARIGQELMAPPNVKGWEGGFAWITTATLLERNNLCGALLQIGQPNDSLPRRRGRRRSQGGAARALARVRGWNPGFSAVALVESLAPQTCAELVDALSRRLLVTRLAPKTRADIIAFASGADGSLPLKPTRLRTSGAERKLRKVIHLIMSTPEFQVS